MPHLNENSHFEYLLSTAELLINEMPINAYLSILVLDDSNLFAMIGCENVVDQRSLACKQTCEYRAKKISTGIFALCSIDSSE